MTGTAILYVKHTVPEVSAWAMQTDCAGQGFCNDDNGRPTLDGSFVVYEDFAAVLVSRTSKGDDAAGLIMAGDVQIDAAQASGLALCVQEQSRERFDEHRVADRHGKYDVLGNVVKGGGLEFVAGVLAGIVDYNRDCDQRGWVGPMNQTWDEGACAAAVHPSEFEALASRARLYTALTANALSHRDYPVVTAENLQTLFDAVDKQGHDSALELVRVGVCTHTEYTELHKRAYNNAVTLIQAGFHPSEFGDPRVAAALANPQALKVMAVLQQATAAS